MKKYNFIQKYSYHNKRKNELRRKPARTPKENKQLHDSIGFLVGADYMTFKADDLAKKGVARGQRAYSDEFKPKSK